MTLHKFKDHSYGIGHHTTSTSVATCPCKPIRKVERTPISRTPTGAHQGYRTEIVFIHNELQK